MTGCTGMLGELVGSHTQVAIYPAYANLLQKVVIHVLPNTKLEGIQAVNYPANYQTTEVILTKGVPNKSGHMQMNKQSTQFYLNTLLLHKRH